MAEFRPYADADRHACLEIFDANCPEFFAANERDDYAEFLDAKYDDYEVCELDGRVVAAFGLIRNEEGENRLCWIMLDPSAQGHGLGSAIMNRIMRAGSESDTPVVGIAASHKSAPFFARFGAKELSRTDDGWGPGMHRIDMELVVE